MQQRDMRGGSRRRPHCWIAARSLKSCGTVDNALGPA
jgi:hypothetical protein